MAVLLCTIPLSEPARTGLSRASTPVVYIIGVGRDTKTKRTTGATDGPKSIEGFCRVVPVDCTQTGLLPAGLMLALRWPLDPDLWTLAFGQWSRRTLVAIGAGHFGSRRFGSGWCEKPVRSTGDNSTADPTNGPEDHQRFFHEI